MSDQFVEALKKNQKILDGMDEHELMMLAFSEILIEMAMGKEVPPGTKAKRISLSAELAKRVGVRW